MLLPALRRGASLPARVLLRHAFSSSPLPPPLAAPPAASAAPSPAAAPTLLSSASVYAELCKARLSSLVVVTSGAGFLLAGHPVEWGACAAAVTGTALAAAAANTFNQVAEVRTDALMRRTAGRPLPTGRVTRARALAFGAAATAASAGILLAGTNPLTAALGVGNIALYALVYTPLKQITPLNTAVGALVGAVPPLMGWAAATGSLAAVEPFLLGYLLFAWQFPHFYALAWPLRKDYARGGYAMVPCSDPTGARTSRLALRHAGALSLVPLAASALGVTSPMFALEGLAVNAYFLTLVRRFNKDANDANARAVFRASLWYLPLIVGLMVFHAQHWATKEDELRGEQQHAAAVAAAGGVAGGAEPARARARGTTVGEAIENALAGARIVGRGLCVHEVYLARLLGEERTATTAAPQAGAAQAMTRAMCPVVVAEQLGATVAEAGSASLSSAAAASVPASAASS